MCAFSTIVHALSHKALIVGVPWEAWPIACWRQGTHCLAPSHPPSMWILRSAIIQGQTTWLLRPLARTVRHHTFFGWALLLPLQRAPLRNYSDGLLRKAATEKTTPASFTVATSTAPPRSRRCLLLYSDSSIRLFRRPLCPTRVNLYQYKKGVRGWSKQSGTSILYLTVHLALTFVGKTSSVQSSLCHRY
jgi:hypothetical protein